MTFSDLGLTPETLRAIDDVGYTTPTPIQEQAIPYVLMCRDVLGIAQTGTGKTASFTLPMIDILAQGRAKARMPRSLILAPTRELASQVADNFKLYGKYHKLAMALLIGGESFKEQEAALDKGVDVLIATPGRLMDLFERGRILLQDVKILVIDEADRMLDMGFIPDVERIVSFLPKIRQTLFFSATMDTQIRKLADAFLMNPKEVRVSPQTSTATTVKQALVIVDAHDKRRALRELLDKENVRNAFIFCNRKRDVGVLFRSLSKHGYDAVQLHGDMPQNERTVMLDRFKKGDAKLMVCSDVAARGIDISDVSHVYNFDVPSHSEDYVHRIGRTGRAGKEGHAYTLATPDDTKYVESIEKLIGNAIPRTVLESVEVSELEADDSRGRQRGGRRGGKPSGRERGQRDRRGAEAQSPAPVAAAVEEPRIEEHRAEDKPAPVATSRPERERESDGRGNRRGDRDRGNNRRGGRRRDDHPAWEVEEMDVARDALAFGGHTPAFMLIDPEVEGLRIRAEKERKEAEAEKRRAAAEARRAEKEAAEAARQAEAEQVAVESDAPVEAAAEDAPTQTAAAEAEEPKKRRRVRRPRKAEKPAQPSVAVVETAEPAVKAEVEAEAPQETVEPDPAPVAPEPAVESEPAVEAAAEPVEAEEKPAPRRTRTTRAKTATAKTAAKPRRAAAKKDAVEESAPAPEVEVAPAAPEAGAEETAATEAEAAPAKKAPARRTTTRKPAAAKKTTTAARKTPAKKAAASEADAAVEAPEPAAGAEAEAETPAAPKRTRARASTTTAKKAATTTRKAPVKKAATTTRSRKKPATAEEGDAASTEAAKTETPSPTE
jgi:superfamily II DNA/RNA helicase